MDPCLLLDPPSSCGRLATPCPVIRVAYVTVAFQVLACMYPTYGKWCFVHACLAADTSGCSAAAYWRLRRYLVVLARFVLGAIKEASLSLLVSDAAHDNG